MPSLRSTHNLCSVRPMTIITSLRTELIERRRAANVSQTAVADACGVNPSMISRFERVFENEWPSQPEQYVEGYAKVCGFDPMDAWRAAVDAVAAQGGWTTSPELTKAAAEIVARSAREQGLRPFTTDKGTLEKITALIRNT